ncbi:hypothetical protein VCHA27O13_190066 [Vibrio chagasii]|nr:hypothetical protein VCHA27O13_190066 [Vibrio chagasii]CAH6832670.1 hypothetical protein VCHA36P166_170049 [Vibrio chagasii]CAH7092802.1 hypothetical protein VCHA48P437_10247 [Vibrio chagasii]CAH7213680.1 hypothetical protein VCHA40O237_30152 [Vibrio chagasii]CAH7213965.1 hypothetical protein VCHA44O286_20153 [Vibrio chagasii]
MSKQKVSELKREKEVMVAFQVIPRVKEGNNF